jgi:hypothetical protein
VHPKFQAIKGYVEKEEERNLPEDYVWDVLVWSVLAFKPEDVLPIAKRNPHPRVLVVFGDEQVRSFCLDLIEAEDCPTRRPLGLPRVRKTSVGVSTRQSLICFPWCCGSTPCRDRSRSPSQYIRCKNNKIGLSLFFTLFIRPLGYGNGIYEGPPLKQNLVPATKRKHIWSFVGNDNKVRENQELSSLLLILIFFFFLPV